MTQKHPNLNPAKRDDWGTPPALFAALHREFAFTADGAASAENALLPCYWDKSADALAQSWAGEHVFVNPPFDHWSLTAFARKAWIETRRPNTTAVLLAPVKSDQRWWHDYALRTEIRFIRGRVRFVGAASAIPIPVAVIVFGLQYGPRMVGMEQPK